jgi:hypothetical protein
MAGDRKEELDAQLIAAAEAAASWARARRAAWTRAPLPAATEIDDLLAPIEFESTPGSTEPSQAASTSAAAAVATSSRPLAAMPATPTPPKTAPVFSATPPAAIPEPPVLSPIAFAPRTSPAEPAPPPFVASARETPDEDTRRPSSSTARVFGGLGLAAALIVAAVIGYPYVSSSPPPTKPVAGEATAFVGPRQPNTKGGGTLQITSQPTGAQVLVDGKVRGATPLTLKDVPTGKHDIVLKSEAGTVRRSVTIAADQTETVDEQIFSGWVTVYSPFEVAIAEGARVLRADERNQVMLPPGVHELRLTNETLDYEAVLQVDVKPGEGANVRLTPAPSSLTVTAREPAEVLVDGVRAGDTPLNAFAVPLGTHEIVVKRANGSEKRYTVTIGAKPFTLNAEF